jgi:quinohemoprotein ethanol dehydrogenase
MQSGVRFVKGVPQPGGVNVGGGLSLKEYRTDPLDGKGALLAWDPVHQKAAWKVQLDTIWNGGTMTTAGNLVFQGTADGNFSAYNAMTGEQLWRQNVGMGIIAAPVSYSVNGKQYVSILAGYGGSAAIWGNLMNTGWKYKGPRRLLTFVLDGKVAMPSSPPRDMTVAAVDDPSLKINPADVAAGHELFAQCEACHGLGLVATGGPGPDLRESSIALDPASFWSVLHDGSLMQNGMPRFADLTRSQVMQIYAYIRDGARNVMAAQKMRPTDTDVPRAEEVSQ